ncbi:hypothetical protein INR49_011172, partial [Caranx melampygus]
MDTTSTEMGEYEIWHYISTQYSMAQNYSVVVFWKHSGVTCPVTGGPNLTSCIKNPRFIEVVDKETTEKTWVIEYDVVPKASTVKDKLYSVGVPKFIEKENKVRCEEKVPYH